MATIQFTDQRIKEMIMKMLDMQYHVSLDENTVTEETLYYGGIKLDRCYCKWCVHV